MHYAQELVVRIQADKAKKDEYVLSVSETVKEGDHVHMLFFILKETQTIRKKITYVKLNQSVQLLLKDRQGF